MKSKHFQRTIFIVAALALSAVARTSQGQIAGILSSDVEGFFGTQSDGHQASEAPLTPPWAASGAGPYPLTGPANVPPLYGGFPNAVFPVVQNIPYSAGHANVFAPDIQGTTADYYIKGGFGGTALFTRDAYVSLGALGTAGGMHLAQPNTATGYAYEQTNFAMDYLVGAGGIAGGAVAGLRPFLVTGHVTAGGYAQFGAEINYWWMPATINTGTGVVTITGPTVNLGSLQYNYLNNISPGPFAAIVTQTSAPLLGAAGTGVLEITGDVFVAGDPFDIAVIDAPEPSTFVLGALGVLGLGFAAWRKKYRRA
jgi:hypothetical protein